MRRAVERLLESRPCGCRRERAASGCGSVLSLDPFDTMKLFKHYIIGLLAMVLVSCSSIRTDSAFDRAESQIQPGMTKQAVYTALGQPVREAEREAEWHSATNQTSWRVVVVSFDKSGRVAVVRSHQEQK